MSEYRQKLQALLRELFQFDSADLDFGIYAVMNHKRDQIERFIEHELLDAIESGLQVQSETQQLQARSDMEQAREALTAVAGPKAVDDSGQVIGAVKTATFPVVKQAVVAYEEARARFDATALSTDLEAQTYNDLYRFFARYYDDGDFNSQRRYGGSNKYVVPYNGEEVLLHWANRDQYYVKTGEYFSDYRFAVEPAIGFGGASVHFKLHQASVEQNNVKGEKRFFVLAGDDPAKWDPAGRVLLIGFEYRPLAADEQLRAGSRGQQDKLNAEAESAVLKAIPDPLLREQLGRLRGEPGKERSLLARHLTRYSARNTRDYFIHKDLGGFLRRELDFFLKNEVLHLEDLDWRQPALVRATANRVQTLQLIAGRIIDFLAQIEDFQKRLWEKRKFVVQSDWCVTLDRVPAELYGEIAAEERQRAEWQALYGVALGPDADLGQHPFLMVDTAFFDDDFKARLLASFDDLDAACDGLLVHSENYQALRLLTPRYRGQVKCIYIDPPYNTGSDEFLYKDDFKESSWITMLNDRLQMAQNLLGSRATLGVSIDNNEVEHLLKVADLCMERDNRQNIVSVKRGSVTGPKVINPGVVNISEYLVIYSKDRAQWCPERVYRARNRDLRYNGFIVNRDTHPSHWRFTSLMQAFADHVGVKKTQLRKHFGETFDDELNRFVFEHASSVMQTATLDIDKRSKEANELKRTSQGHPDQVYVLVRDGYDDLYIIGGKRILFFSDRLVQIGGSVVQGELITDIWDDILPNDLHNEGGVKLKKGKKPEKLVGRLLELATGEKDVVLDFFVGSGTACAAGHKLKRKWIGIEVSDSFDSLVLARMKNTLFGEQSGISAATNWKGGGLFHYIRLETYEDSLNNLRFQPLGDAAQAALYALPDYFLRYMLDFETRGSPSLLDTAQFDRPFQYQLNITRGQVTSPRPVDLVTTFNFLLGLRVRTVRRFERPPQNSDFSEKSEFCPSSPVVRVLGEDAAGRRVCVLWRDTPPLAEMEAEKQWLQAHVLAGVAYDLLYINGESALPDALPIEGEFKRLMFEGVS